MEHGPSTQIGICAGAVGAQRWSGDDAAEVLVRRFIKNIDFPGTRKSVESIIDQYEFYHRRAGCDC